jgi:Tfp pilus assembly protein PilV
MRSRSGYSIVEVTVAAVVLLLGLGPAAMAISHGIRWGVKGRARATAALVMLARVDQLRILAGQSAAGYQERWTVGGGDTLRTVTIVVTVPLPGGSFIDSGMVRFRCL